MLMSNLNPVCCFQRPPQRRMSAETLWGTTVHNPSRVFPLGSATTATSRVPVALDDDDDNLGETSPSESDFVASEDAYPWSKVQGWALRDNVPKYTIRIELGPNKQQQQQPPSLQNGSTGEAQQSVLSSYVLWRSLLQEVPELAGYPLEFLQERYKEQLLTRDKEHDDSGTDNGGDSEKISKRSDKTTRVTSNSKASLETVGTLPYLQDFEFAVEGGICGTVYGLEGVADGSRIETSAVSKIQETLPKGYAQTSDGSVAFELGRPKGEIEGQGWKVASATASFTSAASTIGSRTLQEQAGKLTAPTSSGLDDDDGLLVRLGAVTAIFLAGATAFNMVAHHMTVNVFWV